MHSTRNRRSGSNQRGFKSSIFRCGRSSIGRAPDCGSGMVGVRFPSVTPKEGVRLDEEPVLKTGSGTASVLGSSPRPSSDVSVAERLQALGCNPGDVGSNPTRDSGKVGGAVSQRVANPSSSTRARGFESLTFRTRVRSVNGNTPVSNSGTLRSNRSGPARKSTLRCKIRLWQAVRWCSEVDHGLEIDERRGEAEDGGRSTSGALRQDSGGGPGAVTPIARGARRAPVAQSEEAGGLNPRRCGFESRRAHRATVGQLEESPVSNAGGSRFESGRSHQWEGRPIGRVTGPRCQEFGVRLPVLPPDGQVTQLVEYRTENPDAAVRFRPCPQDPRGLLPPKERSGVQ